MDIPIELAGKQYTLNAGINTLRRIEAALSTDTRRVTFGQAMALADQGSMTHLIVIVWAMLRKHHTALTLDDVGDLVETSGLDTVNRAFETALKEMLPDRTDLTKIGIDLENPRKAQAKKKKMGGTGGRSN